MISVVVCGRNDSSRYDLQKRTAVSLNCIAEMLSGRHDEILFVDYNTPDELPTLAEAISDTLTTRARRRLRVFRVRREIHQRLFGKRTHLPAIEATSRNVGIRRSNDRNRWILSTNTDIVFLPRRGRSDLTRIAGRLADGLFLLPRVELPPPVWQSWPRSEPRQILRAARELGEALHLDEVPGSAPPSFNTAGDFALMPRQVLFDVFGFDERMIDEGHVTANMCARLHSLYGVTGTLADRLKAYHCDSSREPAGQPLELRLENDVRQFVTDIEGPHARPQAASWGLPDEAIEEIDLTKPRSAQFVLAVRETLARLKVGTDRSDSHDARNYIHYEPARVLPHLAGHVSVHHRLSRFLYVGRNQETLRLLIRCLARMGFTQPVTCLPELITAPGACGAVTAAPATGDDASDDVRARTLVEDHDVLIFDFGLDPAVIPGRTVIRDDEWPRELRFALGAVARCLQSCAERCSQMAGGSPDRRPPQFVLLNANDNVFGEFASQFLLLTNTPHSTRVRAGRPRLEHERLYRSLRWKRTEQLMQSGFGYDVHETVEVMSYTLGEPVDFRAGGNGHRYIGDRWTIPDTNGTWTSGPCSSLLLQLEEPAKAQLVARFTISDVAVNPTYPVQHIVVSVNGHRTDEWVLGPSRKTHSRKIKFMARSDKSSLGIRLQITFHVATPRSPAELGWSTDSRSLGFRLTHMRLTRRERDLAGS